ncbi:hypothetical protein SUVZ_14G3830 [Saccharomyces uvarum]|uniref:MARVEL domain-containing protein n=1 Tax=Saccharomyces uvarum TaxID=230603 RepID=A0ABN8WKU8_SACUV|nr:hypothetical protein SUVZ_14G3830 [Saccharomyces uvarum]
MSESNSVPATPIAAWWAARTTSNILRSFQVFLSVINLTLASCAVLTHNRVNRILRLSLAVSIISTTYFLLIRFLPVLLILVMEIIMSILWWSALVTLVSDFGATTSCSYMTHGYNFDKPVSCKIGKAAIVPEAIIFILFMATTYVSYLTVVSQAGQPGSNTRSILRAACKTSAKMLRSTSLYLESCFEEGETLLDLEAEKAEKVEIADDLESSL